MDDQCNLFFEYLLFHWVKEKTTDILMEMREIESKLSMAGEAIVKEALHRFTIPEEKTEDKIVIAESF